jgi:signal transduction histidine kinase
LRHKDGSWHAFGGVALNLLDDPDVAGILVTGRDITERKREEERSALLLEFSQDIRGTYDLDELLDRVERRTARVLPCDGVIVFYWRPEEQAFRAIGDYGLPPHHQETVRALRFGFDEPFGGRLRAGGGETIVINDFREAPPLVAGIAKHLEITALVAAPLRIQGRHLGTLTVLRNGGGPFDSSHATLCTAIAGQLVIAIEALELQRQLRDEAQASAALARVGRELIASLNQGELGQRLCQVTAEVLDCDASFTVLRSPDEDGFRVLAAYGTPAEEWDSARILKFPNEAVTGLMTYLAEHSSAQIQTADAPTPWAAIPARYGVKSVLYVPLRRGDEIVGFHGAGLSRREPFTELQVRIMRGIGELASVGLENARLLRALEQANRLKSEFLATMSHELRTPLNAITGYTDLMLEGAFGSLSSAQSETLQRVHLKAVEQLELINATLDMSRLEAGRLPVQLSEIHVGECIQEIAAELHELQQQSGLEFVWKVTPDLPAVQTDAVKLKVVLKNLITNAVKFTEHGSVTIEARACDGGVEIAIVDTGIGIPPALLPIIFEAFRQGDGSPTRRHGGVGLGLYIVRRILDLLGGTVSVESNPGHGSTFRVWLPACVAQSAAALIH